MSSGYRFARAVALSRANELIDALRPACEQIEIAGSIRRQKESVGDVEIVMVPKTRCKAVQLNMFGDYAIRPAERVSLLDARLDELVAAQEVLKDRPHGERGVWGERYRKLWTRVHDNDLVFYLQVDLFIVLPPAQWGPLFCIRTGPEDFTGAGGLMAYINRHTPYQQKDGRLIDRATDEDVQTPTERSYFKALGLDWIAPEERTRAKLWQVARARV